eukprot:1315051-Amorphochlora_amoeboformis.AAC.1
MTSLLMDTKQALEMLDREAEDEQPTGFSGHIHISYTPFEGAKSGIRSIEYKLDSRGGTFNEHMDIIHKNLMIEESKAEDFVLAQIDERTLGWKILTADTLEEGYPIDKKKFNFVDQVKSAEIDSKKLKQLVEQISIPGSSGKVQPADRLWLVAFETKLQAEKFTNTFVANDGMSQLLRFMEYSKR